MKGDTKERILKVILVVLQSLIVLGIILCMGIIIFIGGQQVTKQALFDNQDHGCFTTECGSICLSVDPKTGKLIEIERAK